MTTNETIKAWTKEISDYDHLPDILNQKVTEIINESTMKHPKVIEVPANDSFDTQVKILIIFDRFIYIIEESASKAMTHKINFKDVNYIDLSIILLHSSFIISDGHTRQEIIFNTSSESIFHKLINDIRDSQRPVRDDTINYDKIQYLEELDIKLYNYSKFALKNHHKIINSVYQEHSKDADSGSSITILTNNELLFIQEPHKDKQPMDSLYGGQWTYIALDKIKDIKTETVKPENKFYMDIIFESDQYRITYDFRTKSSFKQFDADVLKKI